MAPSVREGGCVNMLLQGHEDHDSQGPFALLMCMGVRGPLIAWKVLTGIVWFQNLFCLWAYAASSELWQDETSRLLSRRTNEAQFPADLCPPFPLHSNLSFPFLIPPFSLVILLTHISPSVSGHSALCWLPVSSWARAAHALAGSGHCVCWLARSCCSLPSWAYIGSQSWHLSSA